jgi:2-oxo-4-hydroxy-4-carboxy-5-ureidoimidazoline decarboxylase
LVDDFEDRLYACLANRRWAQAVASQQPFVNVTRLFGVAVEAMNTLTDQEWLEAMKAHPRIGERGGDAPERSDREQSRAAQSPPATLQALGAENRRYEDKFGHVFLIAASGRSGEEILAELRRRMSNDPAAELTEARRELRKIALLRLENIRYL